VHWWTRVEKTVRVKMKRVRIHQVIVRWANESENNGTIVAEGQMSHSKVTICLKKRRGKNKWENNLKEE